MERESLVELLAEGLSVEKIAKRLGRHPSTIAYWMRKHGLEATLREKRSAKGGLERDTLERLVDEGNSLGTIAEALHRSPATVRHWLKKYGLQTHQTTRRQQAGRRQVNSESNSTVRCTVARRLGSRVGAHTAA